MSPPVSRFRNPLSLVFLFVFLLFYVSFSKSPGAISSPQPLAQPFLFLLLSARSSIYCLPCAALSNPVCARNPALQGIFSPVGLRFNSATPPTQLWFLCSYFHVDPCTKACFLAVANTPCLPMEVLTEVFIFPCTPPHGYLWRKTPLLLCTIFPFPSLCPFFFYPPVFLFSLRKWAPLSRRSSSHAFSPPRPNEVPPFDPCAGIRSLLLY